MKSILTAFALPFFAACQTAQPPSRATLSDWQPYIDQPIRQLEKILAQTDQQQPRNFTISNIAFLYDAKLKILFHDYLTGLPESEHGREVAQQRQWLEERAEAVRIASE